MIRENVWRTQRRWIKRGTIRQAAQFAILAALVFYAATWVPGASRQWLSQAFARDLTHEAKRLALTYKDVTDRPDWAKGRPVRWYVTHRGEDYFYGDNHSLPVRWTVDPAMPADAHRDGVYVLGLVDHADPAGVTLTYKGRE